MKVSVGGYEFMLDGMPDARRARLLAAMRLIVSSFASPDLEFLDQ